ncbi:peptidoglycan-binding protein [Acrocarpospora corrugata]|uniref:Peptidoglycan-binding protein n=1 Tax=Acrocarpospora corrugata TaxID=35763 RepID=A0A5M3W540_9ACTN|nr:peptidoglycan-binding protein [Acrocarpospora corrugata]
MAAGAVALVAVAAGGAGAVALAARGEPEPPAPGRAPVETTSVERTDLSDTRSLPGTLGFGAERPLRGAGEGLVTGLPKPGAAVLRGRPLYWVDDRPVPVFFGATPLFRELGKIGLRGRDVTTVADNLAALGYAIGARSGPAAVTTPSRGKPLPGDVFTASLRAALKRWQLDTGLPATGTLDVGQVAVLPGPARVGSVQARLGDPAAGELITLTRAVKVVTVPVNAADVGGIRRGMRVAVLLPADQEIPGKVTVIGTAATDGTSDGGAPQVSVTVTPARSADVKTLDSARVEVRFTVRARRDVLAVPVGALLALREGGYALQLPGGKLLAAKTGMFARGLVEVSGPGITPGLTVVTSS